MTDSNRDKADEIEQDIVETQNSISDTVDRLKERLTPQSLMNSILGDDKPGFDQIVEAAKRNPFAVALVGAGALWLATGKAANMPSIGKGSDKAKRPEQNGIADPHHRGYVDHMAQMEMRENEPPHAYQQRRDTARANYFMIERDHEEDDTSFRKRLDGAGEILRSRTAAFGDQARSTGSDLETSLAGAKDSTLEHGRAAADKTRQILDDNPVIGGLIAAVAGALAGAAIPTTRVEQDNLGEIADGAMTMATDQKNKLFEKAEATLESANS